MAGLIAQGLSQGLTQAQGLGNGLAQGLGHGLAQGFNQSISRVEGGLSRAVSALEVATLDDGAKFLSLIIGALSLVDLSSKNYPPQAKVQDGDCFDFLIVGAGSAGCVVANRLTEANFSVLLIEPGDDPRIDALIPGLFPFISLSEAVWGWYPEDDHRSSQAFQDEHNSFHILNGKMLGGSSGSNYMFAVRGNEQDFTDLSSLGIKNWTWNDVLPYYKKSEGLESEAILNSESRSLHNTKGLLGVTRPTWGDDADVYLNAFQEQGHSINLDTNGFRQLGYSKPQFTIKNKKRQNMALAYLTPAKNRKNLKILKNTMVRRVRFDKNKRAIGVEVRLKNKKVIKLCANKEVIMSAGAINSANLLMRSGIGPRNHLEENGIKVVQDAPNLGALQDHPTVIVSLSAEKDLLSKVENLETFLNLDKFPTPTMMGYVSLNKSSSVIQPDYEVIGFPFAAATVLPTLICSHVFRYEDQICKAIANSGQKKRTVFALLSLLHPKSKGQVLLNGTDPENDPKIISGYYTDEEDLEKHARCMEDYISVLNTTHFKNVGGEVVNYNIEQCKHIPFLSHEYWKCHVLNMAQTEWHYVGTTPMGTDGVVDDQLKVKGVTNLRVVDNGVFPLQLSGNTNLLAVMIGERASDFIKMDYGITPEPLKF